jgi:hypothetical protein
MIDSVAILNLLLKKHVCLAGISLGAQSGARHISWPDVWRVWVDEVYLKRAPI